MKQKRYEFMILTITIFWVGVVLYGIFLGGGMYFTERVMGIAGATNGLPNPIFLGVLGGYFSLVYCQVFCLLHTGFQICH